MTERDPRRPPVWAVIALWLILLAGAAVDVHCLRFSPEPYPVDRIYSYDVARRWAQDDDRLRMELRSGRA